MRISGEYTSDDGWAYFDQSQVGNHGLDLFDDFWLGSGFERLELHVKDRLFFWFLLKTVDIVSVAWHPVNGHKGSRDTSSTGSAAAAAAGAAVAAGMAIS